MVVSFSFRPVCLHDLERIQRREDRGGPDVVGDVHDGKVDLDGKVRIRGSRQQLPSQVDGRSGHLPDRVARGVRRGETAVEGVDVRRSGRHDGIARHDRPRDRVVVFRPGRGVFRIFAARRPEPEQRRRAPRDDEGFAPLDGNARGSVSDEHAGLVADAVVRVQGIRPRRDFGPVADAVAVRVEDMRIRPVRELVRIGKAVAVDVGQHGIRSGGDFVRIGKAVAVGVRGRRIRADPEPVAESRAGSRNRRRRIVGSRKDVPRTRKREVPAVPVLEPDDCRRGESALRDFAVVHQERVLHGRGQDHLEPDASGGLRIRTEPARGRAGNQEAPVFDDGGAVRFEQEQRGIPVGFLSIASYQP